VSFLITWRVSFFFDGGAAGTLTLRLVSRALILDAFKGDHSNFVRDDELDIAWKLFTVRGFLFDSSSIWADALTTDRNHCLSGARFSPSCTRSTVSRPALSVSVLLAG
jgi:hypothetical protein